MTPEELRQACLGLPGAQETYPFSEGLSVFKVEGKIFAITRLDGDPLAVSLKCEPELAEQLRVTHPAIRPGYHLDKRHWNTVTIDGSVADEMVLSLVEDSWALVVDGLPRRVRERLTGEGRRPSRP
jgi:predicted DNA-binding protein (MmcQ/YjbR family)